MYRIRNGDVYIKSQEPKMMGQGFLVFYLLVDNDRKVNKASLK